MGKKLRSKPMKKKGSRSGTQINTRSCDTQGCETDINNQGCEEHIISHRCEPENITQDCEPEIISQDFDCLNEDGILSLIISSLPIKEAVRTCVLSRRWKHIWTHLPLLNFDPESVLDDETVELCERSLSAKYQCYLLMGKTDQFIRSVDSVLQQHQGSVRVENFVVRNFLYKPHSRHLDAWVHFAVASKTKLLYFHLEQLFSYFQVELYDFPFHLLGSSSIEELYLAYCTVKPPDQFGGLSYLKILALWHVNATAEDIHHLLSNCSALQKLGVVGSKELAILSIPHTLGQLHHLAVKECDHLTKIEINAVNVNYMCYEGVPVDFVLRKSSCLRKAKIYFKTKENDHNLNFYLTKLANSLPRLQFLSLKITGLLEVANLPKYSPCFIHLMHLDWECPEWSVDVKMSLHHLYTLLDAAPFLEELKLHLSTCGVEEPSPRVTNLRKKLPSTHHLTHLKNIEISGFYFEKWQLQIILYLLISAAKLDSMTLEKGREPWKEISEVDMKSLTKQVPVNVKLVIL